MKFVHWIATGTLLMPIAALAQPSTAADTIIVTATRSEIRLGDATVPVTVIDREQIELSLATDLAELLRFEAGIDIGRNGGPGQATSVFLRGTESNHALVLVDGVRVNPGTIGGAAVQHIDPRMIERVEIVKGTRSALFGTDAIGGVINIITRRADASYFDAGIGGGSFDQRSGYLSGGGNTSWGEFGATVSGEATDGFAVRRESPVERGYDNLTANLFVSREFGSAELTLRHWRATGNVEYLDFLLSPLDQDFLNESTAVEFVNAFANRIDSKLILSHSRDRIEQNESDDAVESQRVALDWHLSLPLDSHTIAAGVFIADETAEATSSFGSGFDEGTNYRALYLQDSFSIGRHRAFVAARYSDYDSFGNELTWNAEYAFTIDDRWKLSAGLGHAFRAPDATDRFGFGGNPDLAPEVADEIQLGAEYRPSERQRLRLELYRNDIDDLIEFDFADFTLRNIARAEIRGAQLGYEFSAERFDLRADAVVQRAENARDGSRLLRRAEESLTLSYTQKLGEHRIGVSVLASGNREDFGATLSGYTLVNLTGEFRLAPRWRLNARIENVRDEDYETAAGFRTHAPPAPADISYRHRHATKSHGQAHQPDLHAHRRRRFHRFGRRH
ncbi:MAG: TonB-dependent receptor, partial [Woeseiaceae bacterium]|nr:TonB-dependent receptor [Woeseiaceae bacterium]